MAGIYLHIPFCKRKCAYCDFYSTANKNLMNLFVDALLMEIEQRKDYLAGESIQTIYFGGGTPSLLTIKQIANILDCISSHFTIEKNNEITLEANPDDLNLKYLHDLRKTGVNRLSVGIQSFRNSDLELMRRSHTSAEAKNAIFEAQKAGFDNISVDLIYGLHNLTLTDWEKNIQECLDLEIQHISAYHLTIEHGTLFYKFDKEKKLNLPSEEVSLSQFLKLKELTEKKGYIHYEISNFALDGSLSLHNTNYWTGVKYLGLGPSAHSYNLSSREWNISNIARYTEGISQGNRVYEKENLSLNDKFNDYLITSLRTMWGINITILKKDYGEKYLNHFEKNIKTLLSENLMVKFNDNYKLTDKGIFISDSILSDLLVV